MDTSNIKTPWVLAALLGVFPVVGLICSIASHDISMLWVSLTGMAIAAVVFPVVFVLLYFLGQFLSVCFVGLWLLISGVIGSKRG